MSRETCLRCRRPAVSCYCAFVRPLETRTRVVLLQHPRERDVAIGTARMAHLSLPNSELHVGVDWSSSPEVRRALSDPERPAALLYPGPGAIDILRDPPKGPITLVVVDGTWSQAKKLVRVNPLLSALPRYAFVAPQPSEYRIRKEPDAAYVATLEALVHVLGALEGEGARVEQLLVPFRAMIDFQIDCERRLHGARVRHGRPPRPDGPRPRGVPTVVLDRPGDLLCVVGEANAWPFAESNKEPSHRHELVHWAAHRPASGESFEFVVAPRQELAPGTAKHTRLGEAALRAGGTLEELHAAWRGFVRDTDVVCSWGGYATGLFTWSGGALPSSRLDLRHVARNRARGLTTSLDEELDAALARGEGPLAAGRAGLRLRSLVTFVRRLQESAAAG